MSASGLPSDLILYNFRVYDFLSRLIVLYRLDCIDNFLSRTGNEIRLCFSVRPCVP